MADLQLGSQIGGNLIWHQSNLELNPATHLYYKTAQLISDVGGQTIKGNLTLQQQLIASSVLVSASQNSAVNALTRKDYVDTHINDYVHINKSKELGTVDLNTLIGENNAGFYKQSSNSQSTLARNYPAARAGYLTVRSFGGNTFQEYTTYNFGISYTRAATNSIWGVWKETMNCYDGQDVTGRKQFVGSGALIRLNRSSESNANYMEFGGVGESRIGLFGSTVGGPNPVMELRADRGLMKFTAKADIQFISADGSVSMDNPRAFKVQENVANALTRKDYVDGLINNIGNTAVTLATNQTITGHKIFQRAGGSAGVIQIRKQAGTDTNYIDFRDEAGTRQGYIGQLSTTQGVVDMQFRAEQAGGRIKLFTVDGTITLEPGNGRFTSIGMPRSASSQENTASALTRKDYVDGLDAQNVKLSGNQTIDGIKTFSSQLKFDGNIRHMSNQMQGLLFHPKGTSRIGGAGGATGIQLRPSGVDIVDDTNIFDFRHDGQLYLPLAPNNAKSAVRKDYVDGLDAQNVKLTGNQTVLGRKLFTGTGTIIGVDRTAVGQDNYISFGGVGESRMAYLGNTSKTADPIIRLVADRGDLYVGAHKSTFITSSTGTVVIDKPRCNGAMHTSADSLVRKDYVDNHITKNVHINQQTLLNATDLNTLFGENSVGYYRQDGNAHATPERNYPINLAGFLTVQCIGAAYTTQIYDTYGTGRRFSRLYQSNAWGSWSELVNTVSEQTITGRKIFQHADGVISVNRYNQSVNNYIGFGGIGEAGHGFVGNSSQTANPIMTLHAWRGNIDVTAAAGSVLISGGGADSAVHIVNPICSSSQGLNPAAATRKDYVDTNFAKSNNIINGTDLNTVTTTGFYRINNPINGPIGVDYSQMIVVGITDTASQSIIDYTTGDMYYRSKTPTAWTAWRKAFSSVDIIPIGNIPGAPRDNSTGRGGFWWTYDGVSLSLNT